MKCLLLLACVFLSLAASNDHDILKDFSKGYQRFSAYIYKELSKYETGNFIVCPLSLYTVLALAESSAQGRTAKELANILHLPRNHRKNKDIFKSVLAILQNSNHNILSSANKIYFKKETKVDSHFNKVAVDFFGTEIQNIDFSKQDAAADVIDQWVLNKANHNTKRLINPQSLDKNTSAVFINVMCFRPFLCQYCKHSIGVDHFYLNNNDYVTTDMIVLPTDRYDFYESPKLKAKFLKLSFERENVSMHIVLPNEKEGLTALEEKVADVLIPPDKYYSYDKISFILPILRAETNIKFKPILQAMGLKSVFEHEANLLGILSNNKSVTISEILQKVFINMDVERRAYTIPESLMTTIETTKLFNADHPFLYYLRLNKLGFNFCIGRYKFPERK